MKITRSFKFDMKSEKRETDGAYIIEGRPIVYDSETDLGYFNEIITKGALTDTDLRDVPFLVNHNDDMIPLARSRNNNANSTLQLLVDDEGMGIRANLDVDNNNEARALYSAVSRGDVSGMSFMFTIDAEEWQDLESDKPKRVINRIGKVFEVSAVTFPAYQATSIEARDDAQALESAREALESAKSEQARKDKYDQLLRTLDELDAMED